MTRIVGIDPGLSGGLGVLDVSDAGEWTTGTLYRTPTVTVSTGKNRREEYDIPAMRAVLTGVLEGHPNAAVVIEAQQAMPMRLRGRTQGGRSTFRTGLGYGLWLGLLAAAGVRYSTTRPAMWKRAHGLLGTDKRASRLRCGELFPALAPIRSMNEGPAEGLLMAAAVAMNGGRNDGT